MKRFLSLLLAGAIAAAAALGAYADTYITAQDDWEAEADVVYSADPAYTVVIPSTVTLGDAPITEQIKIYGADENSDIVIRRGIKVNVSLTQSANGFNVVNADDDAISYTVNNKSSVAELGKLVECEAGQKNATDIVFTKTGELRYSGTYTDTLTFTVSLT